MRFAIWLQRSASASQRSHTLCVFCELIASSMCAAMAGWPSMRSLIHTCSIYLRSDWSMWGHTELMHPTPLSPGEVRMD